MSGFRALCLTLELRSKPVRKAGPLIPVYRGGGRDPGTDNKCLAAGHTGAQDQNPDPLSDNYALFLLHPRHDF